MLDTVLGILAFALVPAAAMTLGGVVAAYREPGPRLRSAFQHFAAGVVFAAVAVELLPDILHERAPLAAITGFGVGIALMLVVRTVAEPKARTEDRKGQRLEQPNSLLIILGIDVLVDGLLIGIGFAAGAKEGALLTLALTLEVVFLGLSAVATLSKAGASRASSIGAVVGLATVLLASTVVGSALLAGLAGSNLELVLSFGAAALLYLVTEELLVEAHEEPETPLLTSMFFVGFLALLLVEMLA